MSHGSTISVSYVSLSNMDVNNNPEIKSIFLVKMFSCCFAVNMMFLMGGQVISQKYQLVKLLIRQVCLCLSVIISCLSSLFLVCQCHVNVRSQFVILFLLCCV